MAKATKKVQAKKIHDEAYHSRWHVGPCPGDANVANIYYSSKYFGESYLCNVYQMTRVANFALAQMICDDHNSRVK